MSALAKKLLDGSSISTASGTLTGSGTLNIPAGVTLVTLNGQGGTGGDNTVYNPGQAAITASGYVDGYSGVEYVSAIWGFQWIFTMGDRYDVSATPRYAIGEFNPQPSYEPTRYISTDFWNVYQANFSRLFSDGINYQNVVNPTWTVDLYEVTPAIQYEASYSSYYTNPGQEYIAPSSTGGPYTGPSTTATLNAVTDTWLGGYNVGGTGAPSIQTLASTGAGQSLTYSIAAGGSLYYSYLI